MHRPPFVGWFGALALVACSSGSSSNGSPGTSTDSGVHPSPDSSTDTTEPDCSEPPDVRPLNSVCVHSVSGSVVGLDGTPLKKLVISVCGPVCYFGQTDDSGNFSAHVGFYIVPRQFHLLIHGRPDYASNYINLPDATPDGMIVMPTPIATPKYDQVGSAVPADDASSATITAGDVTLKTPDKAEYDLDPEDVVSGDSGRLLRSVKWNATAFPDFVAGTDVAALYALAPFNMRICAKRPCPSDDATLMKMGVSLKNTTTLAPGTIVEFFILGTQLYSTPATAGKLLVEATGKVSADGKTIDTDPGQGIGEASFLGVRAKK